MSLILSLALADLRRDWLQVLCNIAMIVGVVLPLLVILAVRNGLSEALLGDLQSNSRVLQLETQGNDAIAPGQAEALMNWPEVAFAVPKTRSQSDYLRARKVGERVIADALAITTASGDPLLSGLQAPGVGQVAVSDVLAQRLALTQGDRVDLVTDAQNRPRQLTLRVEVVAIVPTSRLEGRAVLAPVSMLDQVEAFYDGYALPEHGIEEGLPLSERTTQFEGLRVHARHLADVPGLAARLASELNRNIRSEGRQIEVTLLLLRNVGRAVGLIASVALTGLAAALAFALWAQVGRKRQVFATLTLMGIPPRQLMVFPLFQSVLTMAAALAVALSCYLGAAAVADMLFSGMTSGKVTSLSVTDLLVVLGGGLVLALVAAQLALRAVLKVETATVLREIS